MGDRRRTFVGLALEPSPTTRWARSSRRSPRACRPMAGRRSSPGPTGSRCTRWRPSGCSSRRARSAASTWPIWPSRPRSRHSSRPVWTHSTRPIDRSSAMRRSSGRASPSAGLGAVSGFDTESLDTSLRALVRRELLVHDVDPRSPERGQYAFVQSLVREVAYGTLAKRDRRSRHLAAARFFEGLGEDELAGALASHYLAAYRASSDDPEGQAARGTGAARPARCRRARGGPRQP